MKISILVFAYNQEKFISECIESIFSQVLMPNEVVINDDFSTDNTWSIINKKILELKKNEVEVDILLNRNEYNMGIVHSMNNIMSKASGDIFVFGAGDDVYLPNRVQIIYEEFKKNVDIKGLFTNLVVIDEYSKIRNIYFSSKPKHAEKIRDILMNKKIWSIGASLAIRREVYDNYKEIPIEHISNDGVMAFRSIIEGGLNYIHNPTVLYRHHGNNLSQNLSFDKKLDYFNKKPLYFKELIRNSDYKKIKLVSIQIYTRYIFSSIMTYLLKIKILRLIVKEIKERVVHKT